jgi:uncharacterized membrane protein YhhN
MLKKFAFLLNLLLMEQIFVGTYYYIVDGTYRLKILCSAGFVLMGAVNLCYTHAKRIRGKGYQWTMMAGLVLSLLADSTIEANFIVGALLFGGAHVAYIAAHCMILPLRKKDAQISWLIFTGAVVFLLLCPWLELPDYAMRSVCLIYGAILSLMLGKAITGVVRAPSRLTAVLALGSALFFFSDAMLALEWLIHDWSITGTLCKATYYPGQCLLALCILLKQNRRYEPLENGTKVWLPRKHHR